MGIGHTPQLWRQPRVLVGGTIVLAEADVGRRSSASMPVKRAARHSAGAESGSSRSTPSRFANPEPPGRLREACRGPGCRRSWAADGPAETQAVNGPPGSPSRGRSNHARNRCLRPMTSISGPQYLFSVQSVADQVEPPHIPVRCMVSLPGIARMLACDDLIETFGRVAPGPVEA